METLSASKVVSPFGKIKIWAQVDGSKKIRAYIVLERPVEGAKTGVGIDGSASFFPAYGYDIGLRGLFSIRKTGPNLVSDQAQKVCKYLAQHVDVDSKTTAIYWATGSGNGGVNLIGELSDVEIGGYEFKGPKKFGHRTKLTAAVKYFMERFTDAKWGIYIFITDGVIDDLKQVKQYSMQLAKSIADGKRNPFKLVIIGVGPGVQEQQMIELDDLDTGVDVDLWDHKIASEMDQLAEIFTEVVDDKMILAENGIIRDAKGKVIKEYRDTGLPALLEFELPQNASDAFTLEFGGQVIRQPLP